MQGSRNLSVWLSLEKSNWCLLKESWILVIVLHDSLADILTDGPPYDGLVVLPVNGVLLPESDLIRFGIWTDDVPHEPHLKLVNVGRV